MAEGWAPLRLTLAKVRSWLRTAPESTSIQPEPEEPSTSQPIAVEQRDEPGPEKLASPHVDKPDTSRLGEECATGEFVETKAFRQLLDLLERESITVGIAGPRGTGKSTLVTQAFTRIQEEEEFKPLEGGLLSGIRTWMDDLEFSAGIPIRKLLLFFLMTPFILPVLGEFIGRLASSRNVLPEGDDRKSRQRRPLTVDPISAPTRYDEKQFLQSLFDQELKVVQRKLRGLVPYFGHAPWLGLRGKVLTAIGGLLWVLLVLTDAFGPPPSAISGPPTVIGQFQLAFASDLSIPTGGILVVFGLLWMWDNLHRLWPSLRYRAEQRLFDTVLARQERLAFDQRFTSSSTSQMESAGPLASIVGLKFGASSGKELVTRPYTLIELAQDIREFSQEVVAVFDKLYVAIDELDKIDDPDEVRQFLRGIKGIFTIHRVCYVLTVSREAIGNFDLRNLSRRDELDSSFREVINVEPLDVDRCCQLLSKRRVRWKDDVKRMLSIVSGGNGRELLRQDTGYRWFNEPPCESCNTSDSLPVTAYFGHVAHLEVESLRETIRGLPVPESAKHEVIKALNQFEAQAPWTSEEIEHLISLPEVTALLDKVRSLPLPDKTIRAGATSPVESVDQSRSASLTSRPGKSGPRSGDMEGVTQVDAACLRTIVRKAIWTVLNSNHGKTVLASPNLDSPDPADDWIKLVESTAKSPLEAAERLEQLTQELLEKSLASPESAAV